MVGAGARAAAATAPGRTGDEAGPADAVCPNARDGEPGVEPKPVPKSARERERESDSVLVARAKRDRRAFAPLYERYVDAVYRYCRRRLDDPEAAADATGLVFAKALGGLPRCRDDAFRAWLFAIAHNVVIDGYRARRPTEPLAAAERVPDGAPLPEEQALAAEARGSLRAVLARLPGEQRAVVELRLAGLTGAEIGAALGKSRGAVDAAQFRAVANLRALLGVGPGAGKGRDGDG